MAAKRAKKTKKDEVSINDFTSDLIKALNTEHGAGEKVAFNLKFDDAPTKVHRWISTGCRQLDYNVSNQIGGGLPEGRIIEIFGPPGIGKSHIAAQIAISTQALGGLVAYIDSENATSVENLTLLGVNIGSGFIYANAVCTEKVFSLAESIITKTRSLKKDVPVTIIWDSVAATSPKAEILGDYDKDSIGLQARALSKGFRKITQVVGHNKVTFVCLNQTRTAIGQMFGDNQVPSGGKAIPFHSSVRIKLGAGKQIENNKKEVIGIHVNAKTIKNKVSAPFRKCDFRIIFGKGIEEHEELFDALRAAGPAIIDNDEIEVAGTHAWKNFSVTEQTSGTVTLEKKFNKSTFNDLLSDKTYGPYLDKLIEYHMIRKIDSDKAFDIDEDSLAEMQSIADLVTDSGVIDPEGA